MQFASETSGAREVPSAMNVNAPIEALDLEHAFLAGMPDALKRVYDRYGALVHTFASRGVGHDHASDVTQEVFIPPGDIGNGSTQRVVRSPDG